jgi:hypothetical protein
VQESSVLSVSDPESNPVFNPTGSGRTEIALVNFGLAHDLLECVTAIAKVESLDPVLSRADYNTDVFRSNRNPPDHMYETTHQVSLVHEMLLFLGIVKGEEREVYLRSGKT